MNKIPKALRGSPFSNPRVARPSIVSHRLMRYFLAGLICAMAPISSVVGQDSAPSVVLQRDYPTTGSKVEANAGVEIYAQAPSKIFGNLFNEKIGTTPGGEFYNVLTNEEYPSFSGNQIWVKLKPSSDLPEVLKNHSCWNEGCWAFYGWHRNQDTLVAVAPKNFELHDNAP